MDQHCLEIERCNQRGGRMLSIVDLCQRGTVTPELAAYLLAAINRGASFMVGALPGGAGKTTVMGALLNFVPSDVILLPADGRSAMRARLTSRSPRACYVCHEIGSGDYYAYLWGEALREYFELPRLGHMLATNLHADDLEQAREQVCGDNQVSEAAFRRMHLVVFLQVEGGWNGQRQIMAVWESDGTNPHQRVFHEGDLDLRASKWVKPEPFAWAQATLERIRDAGAHTIQAVRTLLVAPEAELPKPGMGPEL